MINLVEYAKDNASAITGGAVSDGEAFVATLGSAINTSSSYIWNDVFDYLLITNGGTTQGQVIHIPSAYTSTDAATGSITTFNNYPLFRSIEINIPIILQGEGFHTELRYRNSAGGTLYNCVNIAASGQIIVENLFLLNAGENCEHGIAVSTQATLRSIRVSTVYGNGVHVTSGGDGSNFYYLRLDNCRTHGFYTSSSYCTAISLDANNTGLYGLCDSVSIFDDSPEGCTFIGCHTASDHAQSFRGLNGNNIFIGCYAEINQTDAAIGTNAMWFGGHGRVPVGDGTIFKGNRFYMKDENPGVQFLNETDPENVVDFTAGATEKYRSGGIFEFGGANDLVVYENYMSDIAKLGLPANEVALHQQRYDLYVSYQTKKQEYYSLNAELSETTDPNKRRVLEAKIAQNVQDRNDIQANIIQLETSINLDPNIGIPDVTVNGRWKMVFNPSVLGAYRNWYRLAYYNNPDLKGLNTALAF